MAKANRSAFRPIIAAPERETTAREPPPSPKKKRKVVYNACERCRTRKTKCTGTSPCANCIENGYECIFPGRAHERVHQELVEAQKHIEHLRQELHTCQERNAILHAGMTDMQRDLTTSQLDLMMTKQRVRDEHVGLENLYMALRRSKDFAGTKMQTYALESMNASAFLQALSTQLYQDSKPSEPGGDLSLCADGLSTPPYASPKSATQSTASLVPNYVIHPSFRIPEYTTSMETGQASEASEPNWWRLQEDNASSQVMPASTTVEGTGFLGPAFGEVR